MLKNKGKKFRNQFLNDIFNFTLPLAENKTINY